MSDTDARIAEAWAAVNSGADQPPTIQVVGATGSLPSALATEDVAVACVSVALMSAAALQADRIGGPVDCTVDRGHVAEAMRSERRFTVDGRLAGLGFAPLSTFWQAADGWVRTHANFAWHRAALMASLGVRDRDDDETTREEVATAIANVCAQDVEDRIFEHGGVAVRVRSKNEWATTDQGQALLREELVDHRVLSGASPRRRERERSPAGGVRVLDLTRVIAGPVCTRYLGAVGANVLRLDGPERPDLPLGAPADTLLGKRSAELDFSAPSGRAGLHELLDSADVLVCGYRPGSLDRFGLTDDELAERHPGLVVVRLTAWGHSGPWATRRGFDSIVQAATGISDAEANGGLPGALPCQLLDHGTGYLAAAAALDGLRRQQVEGGTQIRTLSLARTARWLLDSISPEPGPASSSEEFLTYLTSNGAQVEAVAPPGTIGGEPLRWPDRITRYLDDEPTWRITS